MLQESHRDSADTSRGISRENGGSHELWLQELRPRNGRTGVCDTDAGTARHILEEGTRNNPSVDGDNTPMRLALGTRKSN